MKVKRTLAVVFVNVFLFLGLLELTGLVDYFIKTKKIYYSSPPSATSLPESFESENVIESYRLHPYLGYVLEPSLLSEEERAKAGKIQNNYGFDSPHDVPYTPKSDAEVVVGVFGGSVASKYAVFETRAGILAGRLAGALGKRPEEVVVLNFAQGGYKQPQQLLIYAYFRSLGQQLDVVLNIDGFNEIALADINARHGIAVDMPSVDHISGLLGVAGRVAEGENLDRLLEVRTSWRDYRKMYERTWSGKAWELSFASGFFIDRKLTKIYKKRFQANRRAYPDAVSSSSGDSWLHLNKRRPSDGRTPPPIVDRSVDLWATASRMMHGMQIESGGLYLHFIQPNQYFETGRVYGEHETSAAFNERSPYAEPIRRGYAKLIDEARGLAESGVAVHDLTGIFDGVEGEVYVDSCCHYTETGQEILAASIAGVVAASAGAS